MPRDPRVDAYLEQAPDFARPILEHLRELAHRALPGCDEAIKWGMPHFLVAGKNVAGMAAFKAHCALTVHGEGRNALDAGMGGFGKVASLSDLPPDDDIAQRLQAAATRIEEQGSAVRRPAARKPRPEAAVPADLADALAAVPAAEAAYAAFPPGARREYVDWIVEAKTPATRARRMAQAVEWIAEGRKRNWKYEKC